MGERVRSSISARAGRTTRSGLAALAGAGLALLSGLSAQPSRAQDRTFYLDRLFMAGAPDDAIGLYRPGVSDNARIFGQLGLGFALDPFRIENHIEKSTDRAVLNQTAGAPVETQLITYADVGVEFLSRFAVQLQLPFVLAQTGNATRNTSVGRSSVALKTAAPMDMRLDARVLLFRNDARTAKLGAEVAVWIPSGNDLSFAGDRSSSGQLGLAGEIDTSDFFVVLNTGVQFRPLATLNDFSVRNEWRWGLGVFVPMRAGAIRLGGELFGSTGLGDGTTFKAANTPLEWMFEGRFALDDEQRGYVGVGGGTRLTAGYAPDFRVVALAGTSFSLEDTKPPAPDRRLRGQRVLPVIADADKDGITDDIDLCPSEPEDHKPPNPDDGCPAPPDRDGDGIVDADDKCPDEAEDFDKIDDKDGCPEDDADKDGVLDAKDACPKEPGEPSEVLDQNGCPQFIKRISGGTEIQILKQIQFATGKATILSNSFPILDEVVKLLKVNPDVRHLDIEGHTDDRGPAPLNEKLSSDRANAVMAYLVEHGVEPSRIAAQGFGPRVPLADNKTAEGRQKNRRVEFHIRNPEPAAAPTTLPPPGP